MIVLPLCTNNHSCMSMVKLCFGSVVYVCVNCNRVDSVVSGGANGGRESRTSHGRISLEIGSPRTTDTKQLERSRTTRSQLLSTD